MSVIIIEPLVVGAVVAITGVGRLVVALVVVVAFLLTTVVVVVAGIRRILVVVVGIVVAVGGRGVGVAVAPVVRLVNGLLMAARRRRFSRDGLRDITHDLV